MSMTYRNPAIQRAREAALAVLQPTATELEHGLELHREATVVESYGFSAYAAPDVTAVMAAADAGTDAVEVERLRIESMMTRMAVDADERAEFAEAWEASGVTCVLRNSGEEGNSIPRLIERLAYNTFVTDRLSDIMVRATTPDDILAAKAAGKHCFYFTTNGVPLPMQFQATASELSHIGVFYQLGVRMMHLTYNRTNPIGTGCAEPNDGGLTNFGRTVVAELNRVGVIADGAHSSEQTCLDMAAVSEKPVVVSHSTCAALHPHCRAKSDRVLRAVADTGGFTGICCIPAFLGGSGDIHAFLDHLDHAIRTVGAEHVAIGTDVHTDSSRAAAAAEALADLPGNHSRWENFWPANDPLWDPQWNRPELTETMAWSNWPLFTVGLVQRGHSDAEIRKIIGENVLRVAQACIV